ncbi:MAG: seg [Microgenomates group bacterium GW2011_GWC1_37_12b]|uniref:Integral membrane protein n=1 Tax=Candidatus Woesebacteria bacterium GW2011_GWB1_38_8b TaxID=1618571 RepID=A0A0G0PAR7_9BACT|nr:MAG: seg [Microgenomates group bacterium GW2011_GWC1_37_12b]KKQ86396.1 MAG: hypothetical protein UT10_C0026G0020 [Candidatus Woesebacteria bacterium GW2011_GWB1_38_8b]
MSELAQAANISLNATGAWANLGAITIPGLISALVVIALVVAALIFFFMLIFGGIKYITSGGDKGKAESARGMITAALIGLVIVFAAWAIVQLVQTFFGVSILDLNIPTATGN